MERVGEREFGRTPPNVPSHPDATYKGGGWQGWGHWLGTGSQASSAKAFLPFDEALRVARSLRLVSSTEWQARCRTGTRPANMPSHPDATYKGDEWQGWGHWLGITGNRPSTAVRDTLKRPAAGGGSTLGTGTGKLTRQRRR